MRVCVRLRVKSGLVWNFTYSGVHVSVFLLAVLGVPGVGGVRGVFVRLVTLETDTLVRVIPSHSCLCSSRVVALD